MKEIPSGAHLLLNNFADAFTIVIFDFISAFTFG